jgi:SpoVK/Ycf46/Vps4 family AAA+-type ATPase
VFQEIKRHSPAVLYIPNIDAWWEVLSDTAKTLFLLLISEGRAEHQVVLLATSQVKSSLLSKEVMSLFHKDGGSDAVQTWRRCFHLKVCFQFFNAIANNKGIKT